jgi:hypothetical protein
MFGVIQGRGFRLNCAEHREWWSHICGTCLSLERHAGQFPRLTTNYDAALISVLADALSDEPLPRRRHFCPLRGFRTADVLDADAAGPRFAGAVALLSASTKIRDHLDDGDSWLGWGRWILGDVADTWKRAGRRMAAAVGFDAGRIERQTARQAAVERCGSRNFLDYSAPTEEAVGAACAHVAGAVGKPGAAGTLETIGRLFGRIMYLLDAHADRDADRRSGAFNPLTACHPEAGEAEMRAVTRGLFDEALAGIREELDRLALPRPKLARRLMVDQLRHAAAQIIGDASPDAQLCSVDLEKPEAEGAGAEAGSDSGGKKDGKGAPKGGNAGAAGAKSTSSPACDCGPSCDPQVCDCCCNAGDALSGFADCAHGFGTLCGGTIENIGGACSGCGDCASGCDCSC